MTPEISVALGAAVISACALGVSIGQMRVQRKHNKLSVRPFLSEEINHVNHNPFQFKVINCGAGPAIIQRFIVHIGNDKLEFPSTKILHSSLNSIGVADYDRIHSRIKGDYVRQGAEFILFEINRIKAEFFREALKKVRWEIHYESIYGEKAVLFVPGSEDA